MRKPDAPSTFRGYEPVTPRQHDAQNPYTRISNELIEDSTISGDAHWLMDWALSRPPGWKFERGHIEYVFRWRRTVIERVFAELEQAGYMVRVPRRRPDGTRDKDEFYFFEDPRESKAFRLGLKHGAEIRASQKARAAATSNKCTKPACGADVDSTRVSEPPPSRSADSTRGQSNVGYQHADDQHVDNRHALNKDSTRVTTQREQKEERAISKGRTRKDTYEGEGGARIDDDVEDAALWERAKSDPVLMARLVLGCDEP